MSATVGYPCRCQVYQFVYKFDNDIPNTIFGLLIKPTGVVVCSQVTFPAAIRRRASCGTSRASIHGAHQIQAASVRLSPCVPLLPIVHTAIAKYPSVSEKIICD